jgi:L-arabinokinase
MFKIKSGSTHSLADIEAFIALLNSLDNDMSSELRNLFTSSSDVIVTRAPGRLDLMGGIADYSGSLMLELPIANATSVALQLQKERRLRIYSLQDERISFFEMPLSDFAKAGETVDYSVARACFKREPNDQWASYIAGAFLVLMRERGCVFDKGATILIGSTVPLGKGVSSSASLEVATMQAIAAAYSIEMSPIEMAFLCQKVENLVVGAPCGVMDQLTSTCGKENELLELLCQPGEVKGTVKLPDELAVWGIDSGIRHSVGGADYGTVRTAAFMGYRIIAEVAGLQRRETETDGVVQVEDERWKGYLANITPDEFEESFAASLPEQMTGAEFLRAYRGITDTVTSVNPERVYPVYNATQHPIRENARVQRFAEILKNWQSIKQAEALGQLMYQSHESYSACGLGSRGTDEIVNLALEAGIDSGLYGAKITGGGSGGAVAVLGRSDAENVVQDIVAKYEQHTGAQSLVISGSSLGASDFGHLRLTKSVSPTAARG